MKYWAISILILFSLNAAMVLKLLNKPPIEQVIRKDHFIHIQIPSIQKPKSEIKLPKKVTKYRVFYGCSFKKTQWKSNHQNRNAKRECEIFARDLCRMGFNARVREIKMGPRPISPINPHNPHNPRNHEVIYWVEYYLAGVKTKDFDSISEALLFENGMKNLRCVTELHTIV